MAPQSLERESNVKRAGKKHSTNPDVSSITPLGEKEEKAGNLTPKRGDISAHTTTTTAVTSSSSSNTPSTEASEAFAADSQNAQNRLCLLYTSDAADD